MASTTGTTLFNLNMNDLIEEAFERCGLELRTGYDFRTARRSLNLLTIEWANRGINLWTIEEGQVPMTTGQITYALPVDTIDLLSMVTRTGNGGPNQQDININRISEDTYSTIPNKLATGRPIQVWINRQTGMSNLTTVYLAASISATDTTITLSDVSSIASAGFIQIENEIIYYPNVDSTTNQLLNCARGQNNTSAVFHIATTSPRNYITVLNLPTINVWPDYEKQWDLASQEDREKAPIRFVPRNMSYIR